MRDVALHAVLPQPQPIPVLRLRDPSLPGSFGTLDEMMDATSSAIVGEHHKPTFVVNYKGFYEPLKQQIRIMRDLQFIPAQQHYELVFVDSLDELYKEIKN